MAKNRWDRGFEVARAASNHSSAPYRRTKMGAALFCGPNLLSVGFNVYTKSHPVVKMHKGDKPFLHNIHAEQLALIKRKHYDHNGNLTMYVWRETQDGKPGMSKPCDMCEHLLREAGISKVRYINEDGSWEELKLN